MSGKKEASNEKKLTPMMRQFHDIKREYPDAILFFRMGDFYEMFYDDAVETARLLDLTLTKRAGVPMCGVPHHSVSTYLSRMIKIGRKVAICDQMEDPKQAKGIVKRGVSQVITPGTVVDNRYLESKANNFILTFIINKKDNSFGIAVSDISTSEFSVTRVASKSLFHALSDEIMRFSPKEILINEDYEEIAELKDFFAQNPSIYKSVLPSWTFEHSYAKETLMRHFQINSLKGFGIEEEDLIVSAAGGLLYYLNEMQKGGINHISTINFYHREDYIVLDEATQANLEIVENLQTGCKERTLLDVIDYTLTNMGGRKLKRFLLHPLLKKEAIEDRLSRVSFFFDDALVRRDSRDALKEVYDIERLATKLANNKINPKELVALKNSLYKSIELVSMLSQKSYDDEAFEEVENVRVAAKIIDEAILDEPSVNVSEGGIVRDRYDEKLKEYNEAKREGRRWISELESKYREETGIAKLKIRYNNVIGYFIEVTKSFSDRVPKEFTKRQTLVGSERYTTEKLSEYELIINESSSKLYELEYELFSKIREKVAGYSKSINRFADAIAKIDVFSALSELASEKKYVRPIISDDNVIDVKKGRHPVVEQYLSDNRYVANDIYLDNKEDQLLIITGPNMSGKSTYLRQTALIVLLAQTGSFVPADSATIGVVDRIFTRVGASDSIAKGESTFLVEMNETANILNNCTDKSLIIMDEIGRGTSTYDGMSLAWSIIEYLVSEKGKTGKTLFATHYHELTLLEELKGVRNFSILVREYKDDIVFMKELARGPAKSSYGIYAAKVAGVPKKVSERAEEILQQIERDGEVQVNVLESKNKPLKKKQEERLPLFEEKEKSEIEKDLKELNLDELKPIDALNLIAKWKEKVK